MPAREPQVRDFMTSQPLTVESRQALKTASDLMSRWGIRHLPVLTDGVVTGLLSRHGVDRAKGMRTLDAGALWVADVCAERPYFVHPETPLREAAGQMAERALSAAVVMEDARPVGILTGVDVCRALHDLLEEAAAENGLRPIRDLRMFLRAQCLGGGV